MEDFSEPVIPSPPQEDPPRRQEQRPALVINIQSWATPVAAFVMLIAGLLGGYFARPALEARLQVSSPTAVALNPTPPTPQDSVGSAEQRQELMTFLIEQTRHFQGDADAPVTLIEFSDFQWPFCGRFATGAGRQIQEQYVENGTVRMGYWHFAFLGPESQWAAEASECAADQDAFWEYHDLLFESQSGENQGAFNQDNLKQFAADMGLDTEAFNECMDSGKYSELTQTRSAMARQIGVTSTPVFIINGQPVIGAQEFSAFQQIIEQELLAAGSSGDQTQP